MLQKCRQTWELYVRVLRTLAHLRAEQNQPRELVVRSNPRAERVAREEKDRAADNHVHLEIVGFVARRM